jgi:membrane-bound lytic murein transglycosylase D
VASAPPAEAIPVPVAAAADAPAAPPTVEVSLPLNAGQGPIAPTPDLFVRLRSGFQLEDADEPAVDRELNWYANHADYLDRVWARAGLYMHFIVGQLDARHMPRELALLPVVESAFEPYAYSRARASGLWQFIPGTGSRFGLKQNWWYDGRRDVVASTRGALDYLQALHDEFNGDWLLAIAAYNCGELNVERAVTRNEREGLPIDFWHLKLPAETRAYVPKLLAMRRIVNEPAAYGLEFSQIPDAPYFAIVKTGGQIDLQVISEIAGIPRDELYELNPAFHRFATDPTGPFEVLVPIDVADGLEATLLSLTPEQRMRVQRYEVRRGDTLNAVAARFSSTPEMLRELNGMERNDKPAVGAELMVPSADIRLPEKAARAAMLVDRGGRPGRHRGARPVVHVVHRGDTLYAIARRTGTDVHTLARLNNLQPGDPLKAGQRLVIGERGASSGRSKPASGGSGASGAAKGRPVTYTVRQGDTLYSIARFLQVTVQDLLGWNGMGASVSIRPGQKLVAFVLRE